MSKHKTLSCEKCFNLKKSSFTNLSCEELNILDQNKVCHLYKKGQNLFREGSDPTGIYCLQSGQVKIYKTGINGKEQIVRLAKPGDLVGYRSFLGRDSYKASASTLENSRVCFIDRNQFEVVLNKNKDLHEILIKRLTNDLGHAENRIRDMAQKSVRERMAEVLLVLRESFGTDHNDSEVLSAKLNREELANYVGTSTESAIRILSEFKKDSVIEIQGRKIKILDPENLIAIANLID